MLFGLCFGLARRLDIIREISSSASMGTALEIKELVKLSSWAYCVQFGGHDNCGIAANTPYKYIIVLIVKH